MDEALIAQIVARVIALLGDPKTLLPRRKVLALFSGASSGQQEGLEAIRYLSGAGHTVSAVLSEGARYLVGEERVRQAGSSQVIVPGTWVSSPEMVRETDLLLVPTLSMNFASHLALGLLDSLPATLVLGALLAGKPVIAIRDGADPDGDGGRIFGGTGSPALRARLAGNLKILASYGVELVGHNEFKAEIQRYLGQVDGRHNGHLLPGQPAAGSSPVTATILTQADLVGLERGSVLRLGPGSRLTPLAYETATRLGIAIEEG